MVPMHVPFAINVPICCWPRPGEEWGRQGSVERRCPPLLTRGGASGQCRDGCQHIQLSVPDRLLLGTTLRPRRVPQMPRFKPTSWVVGIVVARGGGFPMMSNCAVFGGPTDLHGSLVDRPSVDSRLVVAVLSVSIHVVGVVPATGPHGTPKSTSWCIY